MYSIYIRMDMCVYVEQFSFSTKYLTRFDSSHPSHHKTLSPMCVRVSFYLQWHSNEESNENKQMQWKIYIQNEWVPELKVKAKQNKTKKLK